jgi:hypothetical protein
MIVDGKVHSSHPDFVGAGVSSRHESDGHDLQQTLSPRLARDCPLGDGSVTTAFDPARPSFY